MRKLSENHPYLAGLLSLVVIYLGYQLVTNITVMFLHIFGVDDATAGSIGYLTMVAYAIVCILIFNLRSKKDNYKGPFTFTKSNVKDVWICLLIVAVIDVLGVFVGVILGNFELKNLVAPSITTIIMGLGAGVGEETYYRCITLPIMMKNNPTYKRMIIASIMTAAFFGVSHLINMLGGASLANTLWQILFATVIGTFFAAVYLRTGNILLTMVFHFAHDVLCFMIPTQSTGVILSEFKLAELTPDILFMTVIIIATVYLLRKSKWEDIKNTWEAKWAK